MNFKMNPRSVQSWLVFNYTSRVIWAGLPSKKYYEVEAKKVRNDKKILEEAKWTVVTKTKMYWMLVWQRIRSYLFW